MPSVEASEYSGAGASGSPPAARTATWCGLRAGPCNCKKLPVELIRMVFMAMILACRAVDLANDVYDKERAALPFLLSAVCRHWRSIAVQTPELWVYIAMPPIEKPRDALIPYTKRLLELSATRPICLFAATEHWLKVGPWMWESIISLAAAHFPRWKQASLVIVANIQDPSPSFLEQHAPLLQDLRVDLHGRYWYNYLRVSPPPLLELNAPNLRCLHGSVKLFAAPRVLPSLVLTDLKIDISDVPSAVDVLLQSPQLQKLHLTGSPGKPSTPVQVPGPIRLAHLSLLAIWELNIDVYHLLSALEMPAVRTLVLGQKARRWLPLQAGKFPSLETLELHSSGDDYFDIWSLFEATKVAGVQFPTVRHLVIKDYTWEAIRYFDFPDNFSLDSITVRGRSLYGQWYTREFHEFFTAIARWKWNSPPDYNAYPIPFKLCWYIEDVHPLPAAIRLLFTRILGPDNCQFFGMDGKEIANYAGDDEAEFTDSDEAQSEASSSEPDEDLGDGSDDSEDSPGVILDGPDWATDDSEDDEWDSGDVLDDEPGH